jgi:hypothetical protein
MLYGQRTRQAEEVDVYAVFHLEAWTTESHYELFHRACQVLRDAGIRVKGASAGDDAVGAVGDVLYP